MDRLIGADGGNFKVAIFVDNIYNQSVSHFIGE